MSNHTNHSEYDAIGELFRRKLENHRMPVDSNGWDEIERQLGKRKKSKAAIWLWSAGAMAAAAAIAALLVFNQPATDEAAVMTVSGQATPDEALTTDHEAAPSVPGQGKTETTRIDAGKPVPGKERNVALPVGWSISRADNTGMAKAGTSPEPGGTESPTAGETLTAAAEKNENNGESQTGGDQPETAQAGKEIPKLDVSLVADNPEEEPAAKGNRKWLLAAAFGTGGYTDGFSDTYSDYSSDPMHSHPGPGWSGLGGNEYAADLSGSIKSFTYMSRDDFTNLNHRPPLSFGITARKNLGKHIGVESGLIYTYMQSEFQWSGYDVHQSLHYMGIPVNMVVYLWQTKPNWKIYLSGGVTVEKGLRAIYRQERKSGNEIRITTVRSSIDGVQWSLNGALGVNYRFYKGLGIYFEPRVGYAFDCGQPISMRTEWPVYIGVSIGLNYEF